MAVNKDFLEAVSRDEALKAELDRRPQRQSASF